MSSLVVVSSIITSTILYSTLTGGTENTNQLNANNITVSTLTVSSNLTFSSIKMTPSTFSTANDIVAGINFTVGPWSTILINMNGSFWRIPVIPVP
jgi:hypothetical protein